MKYIKLFNESLNSDNLREFCEINLAYLLDEYDLKIIPITLNSGANVQMLEIRTPIGEYDRDTNRFPNEIKYFYWNDIKDHMIPFLKRLKKVYRIYLITFDAKGYSSHIELKGSSINAIINEQYERLQNSYPLLNVEFTHFNIIVREKL